MVTISWRIDPIERVSSEATVTVVPVVGGGGVVDARAVPVIADDVAVAGLRVDVRPHRFEGGHYWEEEGPDPNAL